MLQLVYLISTKREHKCFDTRPPTSQKQHSLAVSQLLQLHNPLLFKHTFLCSVCTHAAHTSAAGKTFLQLRSGTALLLRPVTLNKEGDQMGSSVIPAPSFVLFPFNSRSLLHRPSHVGLCLLPCSMINTKVFDPLEMIPV